MQREANRGAAMDVGAWLRGLGLEQYEAAFRENAIDDAVLPSLTAEDLKDLGVGLVGHRRKLLDAIAALRAEASATPCPMLPEQPTKPLSAVRSPHASGESRYSGVQKPAQERTFLGYCGRGRSVTDVSFTK